MEFAAAGDFGDGESAADVLDAMAGSKPQFGLALGDLSYGSPGKESEWCSFVTDHLGRDIPLQLLSGNHESDGRNGSIDAFAGCCLRVCPASTVSMAANGSSISRSGIPCCG